MKHVAMLNYHTNMLIKLNFMQLCKIHMLFKVHAELFRKAFPLYGSELGFTHPALPKKYCFGINKKYLKKNNFHPAI